jgi:hypothetical protein
MAEDAESYLSIFAVDNPAYAATIQTSILASSEFMAFLIMVSGDMVTVVVEASGDSCCLTIGFLNSLAKMLEDNYPQWLWLQCRA